MIKRYSELSEIDTNSDIQNFIQKIGGLDEEGNPLAERYIYFRLQPSGLNIKDHYSLGSDGEIGEGLDVFLYLHNAMSPDGFFGYYGNELVAITSEEDYWDNGDAEGVFINPNASEIIARVNAEEFRDYWKEKYG